MRLFLLTIALFWTATLQNTIPQKHTETAYPKAHPSNNPDAHTPETQVIYVGVPRPMDKAEENAKTPTSEQSSPKWWKRPTITDWILAVATLAYMLVTYFMLKAIKRQSTATMDADCALILIQWDNTIHIDPNVRNGILHHCFQWTFKNGGKTPAFIQKVHSRFIVIDQLSDLPATPTYLSPKEMSYESEPLLSGEEFEPRFYTPIESDSAYGQLDAEHRSKKCFLYAYGYVTYLDVYRRQQETRFGLVYDSRPTISEQFDRFRIAGPPPYNRYKKHEPCHGKQDYTCEPSI